MSRKSKDISGKQAEDWAKEDQAESYNNLPTGIQTINFAIGMITSVLILLYYSIHNIYQYYTT